MKGLILCLLLVSLAMPVQAAHSPLHRTAPCFPWDKMYAALLEAGFIIDHAATLGTDGEKVIVLAINGKRDWMIFYKHNTDTLDAEGEEVEWLCVVAGGEDWHFIRGKRLPIGYRLLRTG